MTITLSTGLRNNLVSHSGISSSLADGIIEIRSGAKPASADDAVVGALLGTVTLGSGVFTSEVPASATITLGGTAGSVNTVTVGGVNIIPQGAVGFSVDPAGTAAALAAAINLNGLYTAAAAGAVVTVYAPVGAGTAHNGLAVAAGVTTMTAVGGTLTGGTASASGLKWGSPVGGTVAKAGVWSFLGTDTGAASWFRFKASRADAGTLSTTAVRMDGSVGVSGTDMTLGSVSIVAGSTTVIDGFTISMPAQ